MQHFVPGLHRWATVVEAALLSHLNKFLVHDHHDLQILKEIARQSGVQMPRVDVATLDIPHHTLPSHALPPPPMLTVLQVLSCNDKLAEPAIFNNLIDTVRNHLGMCLPNSCAWLNLLAVHLCACMEAKQLSRANVNEDPGRGVHRL